MITTIRSAKPKAKKAYSCDATPFLMDDIGWIRLTFSEMRSIVKARQQNFKILPGQTYIYQFNSNEDGKWVFRAIPEIHSICVKYDLYPD